MSRRAVALVLGAIGPFASAQTASVSLALLATSSAVAQWRAVVLQPTEGLSAVAYSVNESQIAGDLGIGDSVRAVLWSRAGVLLADLHPAWATASYARGTNGTKQVGWVRDPQGNRDLASVWSGDSQSWTSLHPSTADYSGAHAVDEFQQVGETVAGGVNRASLWHGSAGSWVDLNPSGSTYSRALGVHAGQQVGEATVGGFNHASLWHGTAASWVDLRPAVAGVSEAWGVHSGQQVGYSIVGNVQRASLWLGTADSWMDLHPTPASLSMAFAVCNGVQAGYAVLNGRDHAAVWQGSSNSWEDLHLFLPGEYASSQARGVWRDENEVLVVGFADNCRTGRSDAILWIGPDGPPPCRIDFDGDGFVSGVDYDLFVIAFESGAPCADFDGDGFVNGPDFDAFVQAFEEGC